MRDGCEHLRRRDASGDQRRDAPQRGLLVRELGELVSARAVRDRRGDQLRELGEPILDVVRQGLALRHAGTHRAPEFAVDDDRRAGARADPGRGYGIGDRAADRRRSPRSSQGGRCPGAARRPCAPRPASWCPPGTDAVDRSRRRARSRGGQARSARSPPAPCPAPEPPPSRWRRTPPATPPRRRRAPRSAAATPSRAARTASCSRSTRSARMRSSMSAKATTAPRPSGISIGTET